MSSCLPGACLHYNPFLMAQAVVFMPALSVCGGQGSRPLRPLGAHPRCRQNAGQPLLARPHVVGELTKAGLWSARLGRGQQSRRLKDLGRGSGLLGLSWGQGRGCLCMGRGPRSTGLCWITEAQSAH